MAWILTQPYGPACNGGQRAADNIETLFVPQLETGRCTFACRGESDHTATCEAIDGYCDASDRCRSIHVAE